jgi:Arc/MetJ-type ribon-helix-helix transcriptional regulator
MTLEAPEKSEGSLILVVPQAAWRYGVQSEQRSAMNVALSQELEELVREKVQRGEYDSADALVAQAVRRLLEEEREEDGEQDEILARVDVAEAEIDRGEYVEYDEHSIQDLARNIHERGLKRLGKGG